MNKSLFIGVAAIGLLAACGQVSPPVGNKTLTQETAKQLEQLTPGMTSTLVNSLRERGKIGGASREITTTAAPTGKCEVSANLVDNDKDTIPASLSSNFQDCTIDYFFFYAVKNGTVSVNDADDNNKDSGFSARANAFKIDYKAKTFSGEIGNSFLTLLSNWDINLTTTSSSTTLGVRFDTSVTTYKPDSSIADKTWKLGLGLNGNYVAAADNDLDNFDAGTVNLSGNVIYTDDKAEVYAFNFAASNLVFNEGCAAGPVSGTVTFDDTKGNTFDAVYTSCNKGNFVYKGTKSGDF
jgi:hypothetical protein